jgi:hypothetical protein
MYPLRDICNLIMALLYLNETLFYLLLKLYLNNILCFYQIVVFNILFINMELSFYMYRLII